MDFSLSDTPDKTRSPSCSDSRSSGAAPFLVTRIVEPDRQQRHKVGDFLIRIGGAHQFGTTAAWQRPLLSCQNWKVICLLSSRSLEENDAREYEVTRKSSWRWEGKAPDSANLGKDVGPAAAVPSIGVGSDSEMFISRSGLTKTNHATDGSLET